MPTSSSARRPVSALAALAEEALGACAQDIVVTDVGSTKREIVDVLGADERFIGGHPLAGVETAGVGNAREDLFEGARWYLTPTSRSSGVLYDRLQRTVAGPRSATAGDRGRAAHDRMMATVSHLPHVVANALVGEAVAELRRDSERMPEVGPSFRDTTRVAGSNPSIWGDIFASNRDAVADAVDSLGTRLQDAAELIRSRRSRGGRRLARGRGRVPPPHCSRPASPRARCASCGWSSPIARGRSPSWHSRSARRGSTSRTWRSTRLPT